LLLLLVLLGWSTARANTFMEMHSTYLGNGWFQYRLLVQNDPFFSRVDATSLTINFTNQIDQGTNPTGWTNAGYGPPGSSWVCTTNYPSRPYEVVVLLRSSETTFKLAVTNNYDGWATVCFSLYLSELNPHYDPGTYSQNIVGYACMPCLVPCPPGEADGSSTNFVFVLKAVPDILINYLIQTDGMYNGVDFSWDYEHTFLLQGTVDFNNWTNIAYIWSEPPETAWTTNRSLGDYGQFFRLAMVAVGHTTNLPPLNASAILMPKISAKIASAPAVPRVTGCQPDHGRMTVNIATQPGLTCKVQALDSHRVVMQTRQITATGTSTAVDFDIASLPSPVYFQVVPVE
jgi:hypothetical protein